MKKWLSSQVYHSHILQWIYSTYINRSVKERRLILLVSLLLTLFILWRQTLFPIYEYYQQERNKAEVIETLYYKLYENAHLISSSQYQQELGEDRDSLTLRNIITSTLKKFNLNPDVITREGESQLRLSLSKVPYKRVAAWLTELEKAEVIIKDGQIQYISSGIVSLNLVLD